MAMKEQNIPTKVLILSHFPDESKILNSASLNQQRNKTDKEKRKMANRLLGLKSLGFMLIVFLLAEAPARADDVDQKIKALKDEVARLENELREMTRAVGALSQE